MDESAEHPLESGTDPQPLNPAAAAVALGRTSRSRRLDEKTEAFLDKQGRLVDMQIDGLKAQHHLVLSRLRWGRFSDWMKAALQVLTVIVGGAIVLLVATLAWHAHEAHGLVIDSFSVPPELAQTGLTGQVVASQFLDRLQAMQTATANSDRPPQSYDIDWGSDFKVEIPETGLTFSEFQKLLRQSLGNVSHVTGEVTSGPNGLSFTARLGNTPPLTFIGPVSSIADLEQKSAEAVYAANQPYRYGEYLDDEGRTDEAIKVISNLAINGASSERGWAYSKLAEMELTDRGDRSRSRVDAARALGYGAGSDLDARIAAVNTDVWSGHEEGDFQISKVLEVESQERLPDTSDFYFEANKLLGRAWLDFITPDYPKAAAEWLQTGRDISSSHYVQLAPAMAASAFALGHDLPAAERTVIEDPVADTDLAWDIAEGAFLAFPHYWIAAEKGDWPTALHEAQAMDSTLESRKAKRPVYGLMQQVWIKPLEALALARSGSLPAAEAIIQKTPLDCYLCVRVRGLLSAQGGDWPGAERWFSSAVQQAPSVPFAYAEWARARLERKDVDGAIALLEAAESKNSTFADTEETFGEALLMKGDSKAADAKFAKAARLAPHWGRNRLEWAIALERLGRSQKARDERRTASRLPLSPSEQQDLAAEHF